LPAGLALFATVSRGGFDKSGFKSRGGDGVNDCGNIRRCVRRPAHRGAPGIKHHRCAADTGHALNGVGHVRAQFWQVMPLTCRFVTMNFIADADFVEFAWK